MRPAPDSQTIPKGSREVELSPEVRRLLGEFPRSQVVFGSETCWPPTSPGHLDLFSGVRGVAEHSSTLGATWTLCFDIDHSPEEDLLSGALQEKIERLVEGGAFLSAGGGPVCSSFSAAITPPVRSKEFPYGKPGLSHKMELKIEEGNGFALWMIKLLEKCMTLGLATWLENPAGSWLFQLPEWKRLQDRFPKLKIWLLDYCRFKKPWRKRTKIASNTLLGDHKTMCQCKKKHLVLRGRSQKHGQNWTRVAQAYPAGVSAAIARGVCMATGVISEDRDFDPSSCAHVGSIRVGEAKNPGPRAPRSTFRSGVLEAVPLVEGRTLALQARVWGDFCEWMSSNLSPGARRAAMDQPLLLCLFLREYGNHLFATGKSLYVFRHLLVFAQQSRVSIRPFIHSCWTMVSRWELVEPTVHRTPLPFPLFKAMMTVCLAWNWKRFASILGIAFFGIARPGEPLTAHRRHLVLPSDMMEPDAHAAYLKVEQPKTRRRGRGKVQHLSILDQEFILFLEKHFDGFPFSERMYDCSASAFRRRWDVILQQLGVSPELGLTPGGIRGGGCVHAFAVEANLPLLMWRMRIKSMQTLESYLQEVAANTILCEMPTRTRETIRNAAELYSFYLKH